jgi:hypothetical protein
MALEPKELERECDDENVERQGDAQARNALTTGGLNSVGLSLVIRH